MSYCYLCGKKLCNEKPEHIIPNAFGGHLKSRNILCSDCNNKLSDIDRKLCSDLELLTNFISPKREKNKNTIPVVETICDGETFDRVICIGPLIMMKFVCLLTKKYNVKTIVSMNPIMIDGTGMCGCCRLTVNGKVKFACVDGPDFDGHEVDFDECMNRNKMYRDWERKKYDDACNLFKKEVK